MASIISASTTSSTALNLSGDTTGILQIATGATPTTAVTIDASQNVTFAQPLSLTTPALGTPASGNLVNCTGVANTAKAWVNISGSATPTIRASFNVSSVTRSLAGVYAVNFTNAMVDANYCLSGMIGGSGYGFISPNMTNTSTSVPPTTTSFTVTSLNNASNANPDYTYWYISVFR